MRYVCVVFALTFSCAVMSADEKMDGPKTKPGAAPTAAAPTAPVGKEETLTGMLATSSTGALASLKIKPEKGEKGPVRTLQIWGDAEFGKLLTPMLKKKSDAEITGVITPDGINMKATKIVEIEKKKK